MAAVNVNGRVRRRSNLEREFYERKLCRHFAERDGDTIASALARSIGSKAGWRRSRWGFGR